MDELRSTEKAIEVIGLARILNFPVTVWAFGDVWFDGGNRMLNSVDIVLSEDESVPVDGVGEVATVVPLQ